MPLDPDRHWTAELASMAGGFVKWIALSLLTILAITFVFVVLAAIF